MSGLETQVLARLFMLCLSAATFLVATPLPAWALDAADARAVQIRPQLEPLPDALAALDITIYQTAPPTLSVHNPTGQRLVIRTPSYQPFLTIGPDQVRVDSHSLWFQRARLSHANGDSDFHPTPQWRVLTSGDHYAWLDLRLRVRPGMALPPGVRRGAAKFLQRFRIPVTLGDESSHIGGYFLYQPSPAGVYRAVITDHGSFGADITVSPVLGQRPGLFIVNGGKAALTVLGVEGEPFLRFQSDRVLLNPTSVTWQQAAPDDTTTPYQADGDKHWVQVSFSNGFGWHDPRLRAHGKTPVSDDPDPVHAWSVPILVDSRRYTIQGVTWWLPQVTAEPR